MGWGMEVTAVVVVLAELKLVMMGMRHTGRVDVGDGGATRMGGTGRVDVGDDEAVRMDGTGRNGVGDDEVVVLEAGTGEGGDGCILPPTLQVFSPGLPQPMVFLQGGWGCSGGRGNQPGCTTRPLTPHRSRGHGTDS